MCNSEVENIMDRRGQDNPYDQAGIDGGSSFIEGYGGHVEGFGGIERDNGI